MPLPPSRLPLAILPGDSIEALGAELASERRRLESLELQHAALRLFAFFEACPALRSLSCRVWNWRSLGERLETRFNEEELFDGVHPVDCPHPELGETPFLLRSWLEEDLESPIVKLLWNRRVERPAQADSPLSLLESLIAQLLGPKELAFWQAGALERSAGASAPAQLSKPAL